MILQNDDYVRSQKKFYAREAFKDRFILSETFSICAKLISNFPNDYEVSDDLTYGLMVEGRVVEDEDHLLRLAEGQERVTIEFRFSDPDLVGLSEDVYLWLEDAQIRSRW